MKTILLFLMIVLFGSGCAFSRTMTVTGTLKDGEYGIVKGKGSVLYESITKGCFFCGKI